MTNEEQAQANVDALEAQYAAAMGKAQDKAGSEVGAQLLGALQAARGKIDKWKGPYRDWARAGQKDGQLGATPGAAYSWARWYGFGQDLSSEVQQDSGIAGDLPGPLLDAVTAAPQEAEEAASAALQEAGSAIQDAASAATQGLSDLADKLKTAAKWVGGGLLLLLVVVVAVRKAV